MKRARAIAVGLGCLALSACGSSTAGANAGGAGSFGTGTAGATGAAGTGAPQCQINILPIAPATFDGLVAGPSSIMRVRGEVTGPVSAAFDWQWTVSLADGSIVPVSRVGDASLVEFTMASVGTYTIAVQLTTSSCVGLRTITAARPGGQVATFRLRVTPPSTGQPPAQEFERQVIGGTPSGGNVLALDGGIALGLSIVRADTGEMLPSYVRLTSDTTGAVVEMRTGVNLPSAPRVPPGMYRMLVIPDGDVAPVTFAARSAGEIASSAVALDEGAMVQGSVLDGAGKPITGATVVLRAGELVSTTGTTDATGAFHVRARTGTFGLTVVSPLAAGGLESKLAAADGLVVDTSAATSAPIAIKVAPGALVTGTVAFSAKDATSLGTGARYTLGAMTPLAGVGTLTLGSGAPRKLQGDVRFSLHAAGDGTLTTGGVPQGLYTLTVFPATATVSDGVTTTTLDLSAGSVGPLAVLLAQKVMLKGKLLPAAAAQGARLVALDDAGLPVESEGDAGPDGAFAIAVSPLRSYSLRALPRPDQALARSSFPVVTVANTDLVVQDHNMPPALLYAGRVVDPNLQGVATSLVQAFCLSTSPGCTDATVPVAETVTRSDGTFQLMLPDPDGTP